MVAKRSANELSEARGVGGTIRHQGQGPNLTRVHPRSPLLFVGKEGEVLRGPARVGGIHNAAHLTVDVFGGCVWGTVMLSGSQLWPL
jgi:hypothetical protein